MKWTLLGSITQGSYTNFNFIDYREIYIDLKYDYLETGCTIPVVSLSNDPISYVVNGYYNSLKYGSFVVAISNTKAIIGICYIECINTNGVEGYIYGLK